MMKMLILTMLLAATSVAWAYCPVPGVALTPSLALPALQTLSDVSTTMDMIPFVDLGMTWTERPKMYGVSLAVLGSSYSSRMGGVQVAPIGVTARGYSFGVQASFLTMAEHGGGLQIGAVNIADAGARIQIGALNVATQSYCVQIGAINWAKDCGGLQIGLINYADASSKMLQAGGVNYNDRNGIWPLLCYTW